MNGSFHIYLLQQNIMSTSLLKAASGRSTKTGYQTIPTTSFDTDTLSAAADDHDDQPLSKQKFDRQRKRRCCLSKSFSYGILLGFTLAYASSIYDNLKWLIYWTKHYNRHHHQQQQQHSSSSITAVRGVNNNQRRNGLHYSHPLHTLLHGPHYRAKVSIGPRPYFLINEMDDDDDSNEVVGFTRPQLKETLQKCAHNLKTFYPSDFVLGHRGAALQFPEHTDRSHDAASRMGAGLVECDINLTKDKQLICRHQRCDLHLTTDVLLIPHLANKCTQPFKPALGRIPATASCCTTDFTLHEIQNEMCGRMASFNRRAKTVQEYVSPTHLASYRTDLYSHDCPRIQSHADFMTVVNANGGSFVPEFKMLDYDFTRRTDGYTRKNYIDQILLEYNTTDPMRVYPQGFIWEDLYYVTENTKFGMNSFALDKKLETLMYTKDELRNYLQPLVDHGVPAVAPTIFMLLDVNDRGNIVPSPYAQVANELGLDIIAWTFERSESLSSGGGWYYSKLSNVLRTDSDMIKVLDVLYEDVGIKAVFTDWPSVVTFYANCKGIALRR